jgi:cobalt-zinc-cadmium efflux system outer membrane protein
VQRLADLPASEVPAAGLERLAMQQRLDLAASRQNVEAAARSLSAARPFALVSEAEVGIDTEREPEGGWVTGPNVSMPIPLFDRGQGTIARLESQLRQAQQRYYAHAVEIRSEVRGAASSLLAARERADYYHGVVLPLRHRIVQHTQLQYNAMQVGVFQLLAAKQAEIDGGRSYVEALRDYWIARAALSRAVGGRLPGIKASTQPIASPPPQQEHGQQQQQDHQQHHHGD